VTKEKTKNSPQRIRVTTGIDVFEIDSGAIKQCV
jgi:hypothetical protein